MHIARNLAGAVCLVALPLVVAIAPGSGLNAQVASTVLEEQQARPTFRTTADLSRVQVRVLDRNRKPIRGLKATDFSVLVDDVPQRIVAVVEANAAAPLSVGAPWMRSVGSDIATNRQSDPRLIVVILDDASFGAYEGGSPWVLRETRAIGDRIIENLGPADLVSVVFTADNREPQDFTSDPARLRAAIARFHDVAIPMALAERYQMNTLRRSLEFLSSVPDRRSVVMMVTPSMRRRIVGPTRAPAPADLGNSVSVSEESLSLSRNFAMLMEDANVAKIPVYMISNAGLPGWGFTTGGTFAPPNLAKFDGMRDISAASGGRAIVNTNSPSLEIDSLFKEFSVHYLIGYQPTNLKADGRVRRLQISVARRDVIVEPSERSYLTPTERDLTIAANALANTPQTKRALAGLIPVSDEPLQLALAALPAGGASRDAVAQVGAVLGLQAPIAMGAPVGQPQAINVESRVFDAEGRKEVALARKHVSVPSSTEPRTFDLVLGSFALKPGRYNIRVSAHNITTDRVGSVYTDLTVPDFANAPLSVSVPMVDIGHLASREFAELPFTPTTRREFEKQEEIAVVVRLFSATRRPSPSPSVSWEIRDAQDRVVFTSKTLSEWSAGSITSSSNARLVLPMDKLVEGEHLMIIRVTSGSQTPVQRYVRFAIREERVSR